VLKRKVTLGFRPTGLSSCGFRGMAHEVQTVDFGGWPMIVRANMPDEVAYALCEAIEKRRESIPTDNFKPPSTSHKYAPMTTKHPMKCRFIREHSDSTANAVT
jgi:hypothetical protein